MINDNAENWLVIELTDDIVALKNQLSLSEAETVELNNIPTEKRKREFIGVRLAFKKMLGEEIRITYDENGKPVLNDHSYHISISHSKNWIAVMAHKFHRVGIDIECPNEKILKIYKRFLSIEEQADLSDGNDIQKLLIAWSAKEALFKIIGKQAIDFANQLRIFPFEVNSEGILKAEHLPTQKIYQLFYQQNQNYTLVRCVESNEKQ